MPPRFPGSSPLFALGVLLAVMSSSCRSNEKGVPQPPREGFEQDLAFLREHVDVLELAAADSAARVAVVPEWQARVVTSTAGGEGAAGYGWLNRERIAQGGLQPHMNVWGGEDRLWLGPEGGPFALFFAPGAPFELERWQTPALVDAEAWPVVERGPASVSFEKRGSLVNRAGTRFDLRLERTIRMLPRAEAEERLGVELGELRWVAFESRNALTNAGSAAWTKEGGMPSLWVLGMFRPSSRTTVVLPFDADPARGRIVRDDYFGRVTDERLAVGDAHVFFRGDGRRRGKIGIGPRRAKAVLGSWNPGREVLTLVEYDLPAEPTTDYVDSTWRNQEDPWSGDAVNAYNDGPAEPDEDSLGGFYELETSSPAAALAPGESLVHTHRTFHLEGPRRELDRVARAVLGISLDAIERALPESDA